MAKKISLSLLLVLVVCLGFIFASLFISNNIAFASSNTGVVNNNLFDNPYFTINENNVGFTYITKSIGYGGNQGSLVSSISVNENDIFLNAPGSSGGSDIYLAVYLSPYIQANIQYTISFSISKGGNNNIGYILSTSPWHDIFNLGTQASTQQSLITYTCTFSSFDNNIYLLIPFTYYIHLYNFKIELGNTFTGFVLNNYTHYGYNDGFQDGQTLQNNLVLSNSILYDWLDFSNMPVGTDSNFTYNNINYRFQYSVVDDNYITTNVNLTWSLSSNGDTNHRYLGFKSPDTLNLPDKPILNFITSRNTGYFVCFDSNWTSTVLDLSLINYYNTFVIPNNTITMYSYIVNLPQGTKYFYYLSTLDTSTNNAIDTTFIGKIGIYYLTDTLTQDDFNNIYQRGYNEGYNAAASTENLNFYSLFGAIYDVPIKAFNGLLDFEVLGVNLKGFYLGLLSLCIILFILKIIFK